MAVERGPLSIVQEQRVRVGEIESVHKQAGPRQRVEGCASDGAWLGLARGATTVSVSDKVQYRFLPGETRGERRAPWMVDGRIALGMVLQGPRLRIGVGTEKTGRDRTAEDVCGVVRWCGGVVVLAVGQGASLLCPALLIRARPARLRCLMTPKAPSHTHHTSHMPSAAMAMLCHLPCTSLPGSTTTEPERLTAPVVQCECSSHTLALSLSHTLSLSLSLQRLIASRSGRRERLIPSHNPNPPLAYPCSPPAATNCSGGRPRVPPSLSARRLLLHPPLPLPTSTFVFDPFPSAFPLNRWAGIARSLSCTRPRRFQPLGPRCCPSDTKPTLHYWLVRDD
jgi:hypothetical protein